MLCSNLTTSTNPALLEQSMNAGTTTLRLKVEFNLGARSQAVLMTLKPRSDNSQFLSLSTLDLQLSSPTDQV